MSARVASTTFYTVSKSPETSDWSDTDMEREFKAKMGFENEKVDEYEAERDYEIQRKFEPEKEKTVATVTTTAKTAATAKVKHSCVLLCVKTNCFPIYICPSQQTLTCIHNASLTNPTSTFADKTHFVTLT